MAKYCLIDNNKRVVHEFDATTIPLARTAAGNWASLNMKKVALCGFIKVYTPVQVPPAPTVDETEP